MKLIGKYLKPYIGVLVVCIAFLFVQALSELELPNQMSGMVNTGIQSGGIGEGAPEALTEDAMELLQLFMNEEDANEFAQGYQLTRPGTQTDQTIDAYPKAETDSIYLLDKEDGKTQDTLYENSTYALVLAMQGLPENLEALEPDRLSWNAAGLETGILADSPGDTDDLSFSDMEISSVYEMLPVLGQMKEMGMLDEYIEQAKEDDSLTASQASVSLTSMFYEDLGADLDAIQNSYIWHKGIVMLLVALASGVAAIVVGWFASKIGTAVTRRMRRDVFKKVGEFSNAEFDKFSTASLITRTTNDIQQIQTVLVMGIRMICYAPILGIGGIVMAINQSPSLSWTIAVGIIAMIGLILVFFAIALPKFTVLQKLVDKLNLVSRENLSGMMVIRAFGNERYEERRFDEANNDLRQTNRFVQKVMAFMMPAMTLVMNLVNLLIVWVGAHAIAQSTLQVGNMMAFMQYAIQIIMAFLMISVIFIMVPRAMVSAKRIQEVLDTDLSIQDKPSTRPVMGDVATVEFKNVYFRYENAEEDALKDISFTAKPGETTAFIGSTGSGKSTLINLLPRFYDVSGGSITYNGTDIRDLNQKILREHIGYVPQKGILFSGDIASNVRYADQEIPERQIQYSLEVAQASEFVDKLPDGTKTQIAQGGTNVSGGQRQRLSIARALAKQAPIYIFDDSFSALDVKTDAKLRKALGDYTKFATVLIVAQRVSTIMNAEQIIVLDKGCIVGKGTHSELLETCSEYREIAESQLSKEELA